MNSFDRQEGGGLGGGRASWLVPFDVISRYPNNPPQRERGRRKTEEEGTSPPLKAPPRKAMTGGREGREGEQEKKDVNERKKIIKSY